MGALRPRDLFALLDATNLLASGKVLALTEWDRDTALAAYGLRARVVIANGPEEARREGFEVLPLAEALARAEIVLAHDVDPSLLRPGAIVGGGVSLPGEEVREGVVEHVREDGTSVFVVIDGDASATS